MRREAGERDGKTARRQDGEVAYTPPASDATALAVLAIVVSLVAWNRLVFDAWLTRFDLFTFFLPWYTFLGDRLRDLAVPGWNPHLFSGTPFAGDPESGWMYLPAMLAFALLPAGAAFKSMVALQLAVAGLSTYAFTRVLGMGPLASLLASVLYVTGPLLHWNTYCCLVFAEFATWIPLALLGVELAVRAARWRTRLAGWFLGGLAVSQMFAGWVGEGWLYAVLLPAAYAGYRALLSSPRPGLSLPARLASGAATAILVPGLGMALGAAGILPRLAVNAETNLAGGDYSRVGAAGVLNPPWQLDYLLVQVLGLGTGYHFRAASLGGVAVVLSLLALPLARGRFAVPFFAALTLIALMLTLESSPLLPLFSLIPRFRAFHDHDAWRVIALAAFGPAVLSGAAIEALPAWRGRRGLLPIVVAPLLLLAIAAVVLARLEAFLGWPPLIAAAATTALVALVVAAPAGGPRADWIGWVTRAVPLLVLAVAVIQPAGMELTGSWLGWPHSVAWERRWTPEPGSQAALARETSRSDPNGAGAFLQQALATSGPFRYVGYGGIGYPGDEARQANYMARRFDPRVQAILANGRPIFLGLDDIQGYNPLQLSRYVEFMTALNGAPQDYHTAFLLPSGTGSPLLNLLDVRYVLIDTALPPDRDDVAALTAGRREVFRTPEVAVYEGDPSPPHAWIVHDVRPVARGEALPLLASRAIDPYQTALVEGAPPETRQPGAGAKESARVTRFDPDAMTIATDAAAPGLLVVSEIYESGWRAYVDGAAAPILPTDHALRGIPLPAGSHTVALRYEPPALRVGLIISGIATVAMVAAFALAGWALLSARRGRPG